MVVEFYRTRDCVHYDREVTPNRPILNLTAEAPISRKRISFRAPLDTGFSGYILLPQDEYSQLSESELFSDYFLTYGTFLGPVQLRRSPVTLEICGNRWSSFVETPVAGVGKRLIGRRILAELQIALLGPDARTCVLERHTRT
jgi:predicted aspartyl protease